MEMENLLRNQIASKATRCQVLGTSNSAKVGCKLSLGQIRFS
jgi:hypothetical protein